MADTRTSRHFFFEWLEFYTKEEKYIFVGYEGLHVDATGEKTEYHGPGVTYTHYGSAGRRNIQGHPCNSYSAREQEYGARGRVPRNGVLNKTAKSLRSLFGTLNAPTEG